MKTVENYFFCFDKTDSQLVGVSPLMNMIEFINEGDWTANRIENCEVVGIFDVYVDGAEWLEVSNVGDE